MESDVLSTVDAATHEDNSRRLQIRAAQVNQLYSQGRGALIGALLGAILLVGALWTVIPQFLLIMWLAGYALVCVPRLILLTTYKISTPGAEQAIWWERWFVVSSAAGAAFWGLAGVVLFPAQSIPYQFLLAVFITGISCGAVMGYWPSPSCYVPVILLELIPLSGRFIYEGNQVHMIIGTVIALFTLVLIVMGSYMHSMSIDVLESRLDKSRVADFLQKAHDELASKVKERTADLTQMNEKLRLEIEERVKAEQALRQRHDEIEAILNSTTDSAFLIDPEGIFLALNETTARALEKSRSEVVGKVAFDYLPSDLARSRKAKLDEVVRTGEACSFEDERLGRIVSQNMVPVFGENGQVRRVAIFGRDITDSRRLEQTLRESEEKYRLLVEKALEGIAVSQDGLTRFVNAAALEIVGYDEGAVLAKPFTEFIHPDDRDMVLDRHLKRLKGERIPSRYSFRIVRKDGEIRSVEIDSGLVVWKEKPAVLFFMSDITESKMAEEAVLLEKQRFQRLVENSLYGMVIIQKDGTFTYMNPRFTEIVGYVLDEIPNGRIWLRKAFPDDHYRHKVTADWIDNFENVAPGHADTRVYSVICKDGSEKIICFSTLHMDSGENLITVEDVTLEHRSEELLLERQERLDLALKGADLGMWDLDIPSGRGRIDERSAAIIGRTLEDIEPTLDSWQSFVHPDDRPRVLDVLRKRLDGLDDFFESEYRVMTKSGQQRWVLSRGKVTKRDQNGSLLRMTGTFMDVTERKRYEEELLRIQAAVDGASDAIAMATPEGEHFYQNRAFDDLLGYEIQDLKGPQGVMRAHKDHDTARVLFQTIMQGEGWSGEIEMLAKDGRCVPVHVRADAIRDNQGQVTTLIGIHTDVTKLRQTEQALRKSEHQWRTLIETMNEGVAILDTNAMITYANDKMTEMLGYQRDELLGRPGLDFVDEVHREILYGKFTKRRTLDSVSESYQVTLIGRDGRSVPVIASARAIFGESDQFQGSVITYVDLTQYLQAMEALRESEEKYKALIETTDTGYLILDSKGEVTDANAEYLKLSGRTTLDEIIGRSVVEWTAEHDIERNATEVSKCIRQGFVRGLEIDYVNGEGHITPVEINATVVRTGQSFQILSLCRNITARKKAEEELERAWDELEAKVQERTATLTEANDKLEVEVAERMRAEKELQASHQRLELALTEASQLRVQAEAASAAKSEFLTNMSHELRTPLNAILGFAGLLSDQFYGKLNAKQLEYVREISDAGSHFLKLINEILDLAKVESGKMDLEISGVMLGQFLENTLTMIRETALRRSLELELNIAEDLAGVEIRADEVKLKQIIVNLLSNAAKFTHGGGRIKLEGEKKGDELLITVADTGIGIRPEDQTRIFQAFEQVDSSLTRRASGTGLGLALARRLVEIHGGRIWVESEGLEKGSAFRFVIPFVPAGQKANEDAQSLETGGLTDSLSRITQVNQVVQQTILVVEDDPTNMKLTADLLEAGGCRVLKAYSAEEGIRIAELESPALILMDISLPGMDGLTATRVLKQQVSTARIPVVALTAHAMKDDEPKAREAGCDSYLTKPIDTSMFYRIVGNFVKAGKSESET